MPPPESALPESDERRCPACQNPEVVHEGHVIGGGGMIKSEFRCELCRTAFWFVRNRALGVPPPPWDDGGRSSTFDRGRA